MSEAMECIVRALVRLRNREALEKLRDHRQKLVGDLNRLRSDLNYNSSQSLRAMVGDLAEIDAGLELLSEGPPATDRVRL
jgi:thioester reductase-like protein